MFIKDASYWQKFILGKTYGRELSLSHEKEDIMDRVGKFCSVTGHQRPRLGNVGSLGHAESCLIRAKSMPFSTHEVLIKYSSEDKLCIHSAHLVDVSFVGNIHHT